jgi:hypothetical protein
MKKIRIYVRGTEQGYKVMNEETEQVYAIVFDNKQASLIARTLENELNKKDSLLQIIEDTAPYNQYEPTQETKPFTKEEQAAYWQAEHELEETMRGQEAMYFKGKVLDIPNHLR